MKIADVKIGGRHRKDLGDIAGLARSIAEIGLLHPIVVKPDGTLIAGERRLAACKALGWDDIPSNTVNLENIILGERDENQVRKDFTPSEAVAIAAALEPMEREAAKARSGTRTDIQPVENFSAGRALDRVASAVGLSRPTLAKAAAVVQAAESEPERFRPLVERMDRTGNVHGAYKELRKVQSMPLPAPDLPSVSERYRLFCCGAVDAGDFIEPASVDVIITDPPYPYEYLPVYAALAQLGVRVLRPGGSMIVMCGQSYLPEVMALMTPYLRYHWTAAYLTPGGQSVQLWDRRVNTFWKPLLWFVNGEYSGAWVGDVAKSLPNDNDKRFHGWGQSESGMGDLVDRFSRPGDVILDPFCGGGTTGVAALKMGRRFIGMDIDAGAIETTKARIAEVLNARS